MDRRRISSHSPYEQTVGFSRAVRTGAHVAVAGTAPIMPGDADPPGDTYGQVRRVLEIILAALAQAGARPDDVVRTRTFLAPTADHHEAARAHGEVFADIRPASTMIVVAGFVDPRWLVEMEADAFVADRSGPE
jgi:enamine deaminase RidA (YjgF/YER057c/UK114 family)